jgi:hypothetical protein
MKRYATVLAVLLVVAGTAGVVAADGGPLAAAGLDQEVGVNTTVQLDGTGSSHPDGRIDGYEWSIESPDGRTMTPACRNCSRTEFTPHELGRYDVTLSVTDEAGRTDADTLYIHVEEAGPTVELTGDTEPPLDEPATYDAAARATDADLETLTWRLGDRTVGRAGLSGSNDSAHGEFGFSDSGARRLVVVVRDSSNRTGRDSLVVEPRAGSASSWGGSGEEGRPGVVNARPPEHEEMSLAVSYVGVSRPEPDPTGCAEAAVVSDSSRSGDVATVFCTGDRGEERNKRYADETCSPDLSDCELADPDGMGGDTFGGGGDERGANVDEISADDGDGNTRNPDNPPHSGSTGGLEYIGVM